MRGAAADGRRGARAAHTLQADLDDDHADPSESELTRGATPGLHLIEAVVPPGVASGEVGHHATASLGVRACRIFV